MREQKPDKMQAFSAEYSPINIFQQNKLSILILKLQRNYISEYNDF